jgi:hypothetical protein
MVVGISHNCRSGALAGEPAEPTTHAIVGLPANEATVRGFSAVSLMLVDEAARVPDELYEAVKPMRRPRTARCG